MKEISMLSSLAVSSFGSPTLINRFRTKGDVFFINTEYTDPRSIYSDVRRGYSLETIITNQQPSVHHYTPTSPAEASMILIQRIGAEMSENIAKLPALRELHANLAESFVGLQR
jgi:hypothetical protein